MSENTVENKEEISFTIEAGRLSNIFGYLKQINDEIPMTFYGDKITIRQKSVDNIQYTEIEIGKKDLVKYNPGLKHGNGYRNVLVYIDRVALDEIECMCNIATGEPIMATGESVYDIGTTRKQHNVDVKIKPSNNKIEFHLPGNVVIWTRFIEEGQYTKNMFDQIDRMPGIIKKVRDNPNINKSLVTIDSQTFDKLCDTESCNNGYDGRIYTVKIDKKDGLTFVSKTEDGFREIILRPKCLSIECKEDNKDAIKISKCYIDPFGILNGGPVTVEIRNDKPIVLERKLGDCTTALLTVAPRIEEENKEETDKKINEDFMAF